MGDVERVQSQQSRPQPCHRAAKQLSGQEIDQHHANGSNEGKRQPLGDQEVSVGIAGKGGLFQKGLKPCWIGSPQEQDQVFEPQADGDEPHVGHSRMVTAVG